MTAAVITKTNGHGDTTVCRAVIGAIRRIAVLCLLGSVINTVVISIRIIWISA